MEEQVQDLPLNEKEERKNTRRFRFFVLLLALDAFLAVYLVVQMICIFSGN